MQYVEADPLPAACQICAGQECGECEHAGERWVLPERDALLIRRKGLERAICRFQRQVDQINRRLRELQGM